MFLIVTLKGRGCGRLVETSFGTVFSTGICHSVHKKLCAGKYMFEVVRQQKVQPYIYYWLA